MITEPTSGQVIQAVSSLNKHVFAFVRRSDGSFSYAIVSRSIRPIKEQTKNIEADEECLTFVMCCRGSTKLVRKRFWRDYVRLVYVPALDKHSVNEHTVSESR